MKLESILSDVILSSGRTGITIIRGIIIIPVLTKLLGVDEYGLWVSVLAIVTIASGVGGLHLKGSLIRYTPHESVEGQTFVDILSISILSAIGCSILFLAANSTVGIIPEQDGGVSIATSAALLIALYILSEVVLNYPRSRNNIRQYEIIQTSHIIVETFSLLLVFLVTRSLIAGFHTLIAISTIFIAGLLVVFHPNQFIIPDINRFPRYLRYSLPMVPKEIGTRVITNADKYIILYFLSPTAVGVYAVAYSVAKFFENLTSVLNPTLYPNVIRAWDQGDMRDLHILYETIFRWYSLLAFPALFGMTLLSEQILLVLSTPEVASDGSWLLPVLASGFLMRGYDNPLAYIFNATEENEKIAVIVVVASILNIILNIIFIPIIGISGAVIATLFSQSIIMSYMLYHSRTRIPFRIPFESITKAFIGSLIMVGFLLVMPINFTWWQDLFIFPTFGAIIYSIALLSLGEISRNEISEIVNKIGILKAD